MNPLEFLLGLINASANTPVPQPTEEDNSAIMVEPADDDMEAVDFDNDTVGIIGDNDGDTSDGIISDERVKVFLEAGLDKIDNPESLFKMIRTSIPNGEELSTDDLINALHYTVRKTVPYSIMKNGGPKNIEELKIVLNGVDHSDFEHGYPSDDWNDEILQKYADYVKNYYYHYKPEAVEELDQPAEQQIGVMAQDVEKVNPAVVNEDEDGIKSVDTGRLALMNAGAIGELARDVEELQDDERLED